MPPADSSRRASLACLVLLLLGIAGSFESVWRTPSVLELLGSGDSHWYFGPQNAFFDWSLARGEWPLWGPLNFCGQPFAANPQTGVFYPPNALRSFLTGLGSEPTPLRTHVGTAVLSALHILAAGFGAFRLARAQSLSTGASLVAAWGFAFSASFVRRVVGNQFLGVVSWLPFMLLALQRVRDAGRSPAAGGAARVRLHGTLIAGLWYGLSLLGGFPQLSIYVGVGLAVFLLAGRVLDPAHGSRARSDREPGTAPGTGGGRDIAAHAPAGKEGSTLVRALGTDVLSLAGLLLIAVLVAAPMLLPAAEFLRASTRLDPATALGPELALTNQFPGTLALLRALVTYPGSADFALNYRASGAAILILALLAALHREKRAVSLWAVLFFAFLDCSIGPPAPLSTLLARLLSSPLITPSRGFFLACLPLALLAGYGIDALDSGPARGRRSARLAAPLLAGLPVCALLSSGLGDEALLGQGAEVLVFPALIILVATLALWKRPAWTPALLLAVVAAETLTWNHAFVPHLIETRAFAGDLEALGRPQDLARANRRGTSDRSNGLLYGLEPSMIGYDPLQLARARRVICSPADEGQYLREIREGDATALNRRGHALLKRIFWLARRFTRSVLPDKDTLFPAADTAFLLTDASLTVPEVQPGDVPTTSLGSPGAARPVAGPGSEATDLAWEPGRQGRQQRLVIPRFELPNRHSALRLRYRSADGVKLRVVFHGEEPGHSVPGATLTLSPTGSGIAEVETALPDWASVRVRLSVPPDAEAPTILAATVVGDEGDEDARLEIVEWGANRVRLEVGPLDGPRVLTFVDAHFPGWEAFVDDEPVPIHLAADAFKAVELPAGTHRVRFEFHSRRLPLGIGLCALTLVACGLVLGLGRTRSNR